jgi:AcrR family transcriptional regulator
MQVKATRVLFMTRARSTRSRTQQERSTVTTGTLIDAARKLFAAQGYAGTSLDDVARESDVTKGALYHHFEDKTALFRAVFEGEQRRLAAQVAEAHARQSDRWKGFHMGCRAFLDALLESGVQRIALLDAPAVLGWDGMRAIEARYSFALLLRGLEFAIADGRIAPRVAEPLAHMLFGAMCEGAMFVARSSHPRAAHKQVLSELAQQLEALTVDAGQ